MRETSFIKQNKEKWKEFEKILEYKDKDPDKLNDLFIQITDDLSYSRTFYPNRSVRVYLNNLAQQIFYSIYKNKKTRAGRLWYFWSEELPQLIYNARNEFRLAFFVFALSMIIGMVSSAMNPEFPRVILGDNYVDMTIENIESGDPMAVYKQGGEYQAYLGITANNLYVAFLTFVLGVLFGIGSIGLLVSNGIMVGAFQYFFIEKGIFQESFLTIWTHGTLEISAIIIAGAAGITLGRGLAFPGTLTRLQAFQVSARRGIKIMLGITPIIIMAGFIEGYLTRYTETPDLIRLLFILLCLAFVLSYFVWYPVYKARKGFRAPVKDTELPPDAEEVIAYDRIKHPGEVFSDVFIFTKKYLIPLATSALVLSMVYCSLTFSTATVAAKDLFSFPNHYLGAISVVGQYFAHAKVNWLPLINAGLLCFALFVPMTYLVKHSSPEALKDKNLGFYIIQWLKILPAALLFSVILYTSSWYTYLLCLLIVPFLLMWGFIAYREKIGILHSLGRTFTLISGNYIQLLGIYILLFLVGALFYTFLDSTVLWLFFDIIGWNLALEQGMMDQVLAVLVTFVSMFFLLLFFSILAVGTGLTYFSILEIEEAPSLRKKIKYIGVGKRIQGMEAEGETTP